MIKENKNKVKSGKKYEFYRRQAKQDQILYIGKN